MVEEEAATSPQMGKAPDMGWHPTGAAPKDPGWYPMGTNPNDQSYWDGQTWTGRRHWTVNGWSEEGDAMPAAASTATAPVGGRRATRTPRPLQARSTSSPTSLNIGVLLLMVSGIALMFGSVGSWIHASGSVGIVTFHGTINGTDPAISQLIGVNGYVTFIAGIVLLVFGGLALANDDELLGRPHVRCCRVTLVFAVYDMFRIVQKISNVTVPANSISVGAGLICVLSAAACGDDRGDRPPRVQIAVRGGRRRRISGGQPPRTEQTLLEGCVTAGGPRTAARWRCGSAPNRRSS